MQLCDVLNKRFGAKLAGSWASGEGHLPEPIANKINSLSDVDVQLNKAPNFDLTRAITLVLAKVSVRQQSEINALWSAARIVSLSNDKLRIARFLAFWACIGAVEAGAVGYPECPDSARAYGLTKFFFKFYRNVLLFVNCRPNSYRELAAAVRLRICDDRAVDRAYELKIGSRLHFSSEDVDVLLSQPLLREVLEPIAGAALVDFLVPIWHHVRQWYFAGDTVHWEICLKQV
jgi:hypothetical protein